MEDQYNSQKQILKLFFSSNSFAVAYHQALLKYIFIMQYLPNCNDKLIRHLEFKTCFPALI